MYIHGTLVISDVFIKTDKYEKVTHYSGRFDHRPDLSIEVLEQKRNNKLVAEPSPDPSPAPKPRPYKADDEDRQIVKERIAQPRPEVTLRPSTVQIGENSVTLFSFKMWIALV